MIKIYPSKPNMWHSYAITHNDAMWVVPPETTIDEIVRAVIRYTNGNSVMASARISSDLFNDCFVTDVPIATIHQRVMDHMAAQQGAIQ